MANPETVGKTLRRTLPDTENSTTARVVRTRALEDFQGPGAVSAVLNIRKLDRVIIRATTLRSITMGAGTPKLLHAEGESTRIDLMKKVCHRITCFLDPTKRLRLWLREKRFQTC